MKKSKAKKERSIGKKCPGLGFQIENWEYWDEEIHQAASTFLDWYGMYPNRVFCSKATLKRVKAAFWNTVTSCSNTVKSSSTGSEESLAELGPQPERFFFQAKDYTLSFTEEGSLPEDTLVLIYI